jgi:hypothetical protein
MNADRVPQHDVGLLNPAVGGGPLRKAHVPLHADAAARVVGWQGFGYEPIDDEPIRRPVDVEIEPEDREPWYAM